MPTATFVKILLYLLGDGCQNGRQVLCIYKPITNFGLIAADSVNNKIYHAVYLNITIMVYDVATQTHSRFLTAGLYK